MQWFNCLNPIIFLSRMNWDSKIMVGASSPTVPTQCILHRKRFTLVVLVQLKEAVSTTANMWNPQMLNEKNQLGQSAGQTLICLWAENKVLRTKLSGIWCLEQAGTVQHIPVSQTCAWVACSWMLQLPTHQSAVTAIERKAEPVCLGRGCWAQQRTMVCQAPGWRPQTHITISGETIMAGSALFWFISAAIQSSWTKSRAWRVPRAMNVSSSLSSHGSHWLSH